MRLPVPNSLKASGSSFCKERVNIRLFCYINDWCTFIDINLCQSQRILPFQSQSEVRIDLQRHNLQPTEIHKMWCKCHKCTKRQTKSGFLRAKGVVWIYFYTYIWIILKNGIKNQRTRGENCDKCPQFSTNGLTLYLQLFCSVHFQACEIFNPLVDLVDHWIFVASEPSTGIEEGEHNNWERRGTCCTVCRWDIFAH